MASKLSLLPPAKVTHDFAEYLKKLLYTQHTLKQHNLEESNISEVFTHFLQQLSTPPIHTTILTNTLLTSRDYTIAQLQKLTKYEYSIELSPSVPECILMKSQIGNPTQIHCESTVHIVVEYKCGMAVLRGADVYAPGIMAISNVVNIGNIVSVFCDVEGKCTRGMTQIQKDKFTLVFLGNGVLKMGREIFKGEGVKKGLAIEMTEPIYKTPSLNNLMLDTIYLQNFPSMLVAESLAPKPGNVILDMCAAPGGKAIHSALKMLGKGIIIALDCKQSRVDVLQANVSNFQLNCIKTIKFDSTKSCDIKKPVLEITMDSLPPYPPESFDKILVDAPCSGLGHRPQCFMSELKSCNEYQRQFLSQAVRLLKIGGYMVYSTCSINPLENEENVAWVLGKWPEIILIDAGVIMGRNGLLGYGLDQSSVEKVRRFGPTIYNESVSNSMEDTIGFFIAKFTKL
ncbi:Methyltransferase NSUN6 isoform X2 [Oopsacas minuta]|uniref:Methyltransferase NSUN6 isoform X2 n=1 Tax=Oopsacas minuta TaxID=111878 RepID=A0AAV7JUB2_9METZ|nr:Methyltransferase NSUN6 isoform X2 [Oopsacas minuta]